MKKKSDAFLIEEELYFEDENTQEEPIILDSKMLDVFVKFNCTPFEVSLYLALKFFVKQQKMEIKVYQSKLAEYSLQSLTSVKKYLSELQQKGLIEIKGNYNTGTKQRYASTYKIMSINKIRQQLTMKSIHAEFDTKEFDFDVVKKEKTETDEIKVNSQNSIIEFQKSQAELILTAIEDNGLIPSIREDNFPIEFFSLINSLANEKEKKYTIGGEQKSIIDILVQFRKLNTEKIIKAAQRVQEYNQEYKNDGKKIANKKAYFIAALWNETLSV
jgi:hypothetical protein